MDDETRRSGILAGQVAALGPAFRQRLVRDRKQIEALLQEIAAAGDAASSAVRQIELAAHKLHGTSAMFGYESLGRSAGRLEAVTHAIHEGHVPGARAAAELRAPFDDLCGEIERALAGTPEAGG